MPKNLPVKVGHKFVGGECCGREMQFVGDGIWECGCGCYVSTDPTPRHRAVVTKIGACPKHS